MRRLTRQQGTTLIELMIGLVVGMLAVVSGLNFYLLIARSQTGIAMESILSQNLSNHMALMVEDIRRAGYQQIPDLPSLPNPFLGPTTDIQVHEGGSCILYTYDRNFNSSADPAEFFGFRVRQQTLETRTSGSDNLSCESGDWELISDPETYVIDQLIFDTTRYKCLNTLTLDTWDSHCDDASATDYVAPLSGQRLVEIRQIGIQLSGSLMRAPFFSSKMHQQTVRVRNDKLIIIP